MTITKKDISWWAAILVPAMVFAAFAMVQPAESHDMPYDWDPVRSQQWVGTCGGNAKNMVYAVQGMMLAGGYYDDAGYTNTVQAQWDGAIGTKTKNAIKKYQSAHGLSADGCVGPGTWNSLRYHHMSGSWPDFTWNGSSHSGWADHNIGFSRTHNGSTYVWTVGSIVINHPDGCHTGYLNSNDTMCDHSGGVCAGSRTVLACN